MFYNVEFSALFPHLEYFRPRFWVANQTERAEFGLVGEIVGFGERSHPFAITDGGRVPFLNPRVSSCSDQQLRISKKRTYTVLVCEFAPITRVLAIWLYLEVA